MFFTDGKQFIQSLLAESKVNLKSRGNNPPANLQGAKMQKEKAEYPKFLYHKTQGEKIARSEADKEFLGKDWSETPFDVSKIDNKKTFAKYMGDWNGVELKKHEAKKGESLDGNSKGSRKKVT